MTSSKHWLSIVGAALTGAIIVSVIPRGWMLPAVLAPFGTCMLLSWYVALQQRPTSFSSFRSLGWPALGLKTKLGSTLTLRLLCVAAGFSIGGCLVLLVRIANPG